MPKWYLLYMISSCITIIEAWRSLDLCFHCFLPPLSLQPTLILSRPSTLCNWPLTDTREKNKLYLFVGFVCLFVCLCPLCSHCCYHWLSVCPFVSLAPLTSVSIATCLFIHLCNYFQLWQTNVNKLSTCNQSKCIKYYTSNCLNREVNLKVDITQTAKLI